VPTASTTANDKPTQLPAPPRIPPKPSTTKRVAPLLPTKTSPRNAATGSEFMNFVPGAPGMQ